MTELYWDGKILPLYWSPNKFPAGVHQIGKWMQFRRRWGVKGLIISFPEILKKNQEIYIFSNNLFTVCCYTIKILTKMHKRKIIGEAWSGKKSSQYNLHLLVSFITKLPDWCWEEFWTCLFYQCYYFILDLYMYFEETLLERGINKCFLHGIACLCTHTTYHSWVMCRISNVHLFGR